MIGRRTSAPPIAERGKLSAVFRRRGHERAEPDALISDAHWILLGRAPSDSERVDLEVLRRDRGDAGVLTRLLSSPEFHLIVSGWRDDVGIGKDPVTHEAGLQAIGDAERFTRLAYSYVLGRDADASGLAHYAAALAAGDARRNLVRALVVSDEFEARYTPLAAKQGGGYLPRDVQLCELANPAKWDNPDWIRLLKSLTVVPHHKLAMHRKSYEWTQLLFGLSRLGFLAPARDDASILSVGAGHECILYWLANHAGQVTATDLYEGRWTSDGSREGDAEVITDPDRFAPFEYRRDRLSFHRMDGRSLGFDEARFDVVYSLSSIEHFGGFDGARQAVMEMARVLKPGGVLALATEYIVSGPDHEEAFQPDVFRRLIDVPDLALVEPIDERVHRRYESKVVDLRADIDQRPHMVVRIGETVFTSVMVFLRKTVDVAALVEEERNRWP
jgi:SAM-dependent methyltransferase